MIDLAFLDDMQAVTSAYNELRRARDEETNNFGSEYGVEHLPAFPVKRFGIFHEPTWGLHAIRGEDDLIDLLERETTDDTDDTDDTDRIDETLAGPDDTDDAPEPIELAPASAPTTHPEPPIFVGMGRSHARLHARHDARVGG